MADSITTTRVRFWLSPVRFVGLIVPRRLRVDWRQEWEAELQWREQQLAEWEKLDAKNKLALMWHSAGAFADALWLQPKRWEDELMQDLRYGVRMLLKNRAFTLVTVLTLALGIGANTALFSVIDSVLLRPLPFDKPEQLVHISSAGYLFNLYDDSSKVYLSPAEHAANFAQVAEVEIGRVSLTEDAAPERIQLMRAMASFFPLLGVRPLLGRVFTEAEQQAGQNRVALLSHRLWQSRFGADANVLGKKVHFSGQSFTIIGVMPDGFDFYVSRERADLYVPMTPGDKLLSTEGWRETIGRMRPGVSLRQAGALMELVFQRLAERRPDMKRHENTQKPRLTPLAEHWAGDLQTPLWILLGAVVCVLLIACANAANLLLARAAARQKEIAIRAALGASRLRLLRQWLTESSLLSLMGGAVGLLLAAWGVKGIVAVSPIHAPMMDRIGIDGRVLLFTLAISLLTGLLFGLAPAWQFSKSEVNAFLKEGGRRGAGGFSPRLRNALTVAEIALAMVLLVSAGLLVKSFQRILTVPLGFDPKNVLTLELSPPAARYPEAAQRAQFYQQVIDRVRALPGVEAAGTINHLPLASGDLIIPVSFAGLSLPGGSQPTLSYRVASADYFRAMGLQLIAGRFFTDADTADAPRVVLIEQTVAERLKRTQGSQGELLGAHMTFRNQDYEIVGIVADVKHQAIDAPIYPGFYLPMPQRPSSYAGWPFAP